MKKTLSFTFILFTALLFAQIPSYYGNVNLNQTGTALKDELASKITITQTTVLSYTPGVWNALQQADLDPTDASKVLLIYGYNDNDGDFKTDRTRGVNNNGGGTGLWNREHVYPRSLGIPNLGSTGPGSDAHHLRPSDGQMNSSRSNRKFASGSGNAAITSNGNFYPGDEWKGDVARMMLYMYLRYGNRCLPNNVGVGNAVAGDSNMIDLFLQWNVDDPVNAYEDNRNDVIAGIQGNRNPFIDNPAFATQIWGGPQAENRFGTSVGDGGSGTTSELFISEYIEGSSNNKALEVANFTGNTINLSGYSLRKQTNGSGTWSSGFNLSGNLANGDVYVLANSSANSTILSQADATGGSSTTFNGNDAVGLFKNGTLIDIIGVFNGGSSNFAKDVTLVRKSSISSPNTTYTIAEWNQFPQNTFSNLGSHTLDGGTTTLTYCDSDGNNSSFEFIDFVRLGGISNSSSSRNGYSDFTNQTANISYGNNTIVFSAGFSGQSYTEYWRAWIDFNQNGSFESSEEIVSGSSSSSGNLSSNFTVPSSALSGNTRLRLSMKWNAAPTACESFSYGEVEDYTVNIGGSSARFVMPSETVINEDELTEEAPVFKSTVYSSYDALNLEMQDEREVSYAIYNMSGRIVAQGKFTKKVKLNNINKGMYIMHINDGQRLIKKKIIRR